MMTQMTVTTKKGRLFCHQDAAFPMNSNAAAMIALMSASLKRRHNSFVQYPI